MMMRHDKLERLSLQKFHVSLVCVVEAYIEVLSTCTLAEYDDAS
jgi:hypothetical protein